MAAAADDKVAVLVVDDDGDIRGALEMMLQYEGFEVWTARDGQEALARIEREESAGRAPAIVLTDVKMPKLDGLGLLEALMKRSSVLARPAVVMVSGHGDVATAVDAVRRGALDFIEKPLEQNRVLVSLRHALRERKLESENVRLKQRLSERWQIIGASAAMTTLREQVARAALSEIAVLITGENGTGKEVVARHVHHSSPRATGAFVTVNCAAIPSELIESELFGHEKGSFTGASERRLGHFELAHKGTLFLDEIGDMPLAAQAKVLRALETHEIARVGGNRSIPVDIRVVAATNADLAQAVEEKTFRMDLFYRLNVIPLRVPPLRERREDIPVLAAHFLGEIAQRSGRTPLELEPDALELLKQHDFPGNVRQLKNLLEGASVFAAGPTVRAADIAQILESGPALSPAPGSIGADAFDAPTFEQFKDLSETIFFRKKLDENSGNIKRTAEQLGMQRSHLYKKLDRYGLR